MGPVKELVKRLGCLPGKCQLLIVCGRNERLYEDIKWLAPDLKIKANVYGFVNNMHELMEISDIIVTKTGGLTTEEALAKSLPVISIAPIPGQEAGNTKILLKYKAGFEAGSADEAAEIIAKLFSSGSLAEMKERARAIARPNASKETALFIYNLLSPLP